MEGVYRIGKTPAANVSVTLNVDGRSSYGDDLPSIFPFHTATTARDGRFVFDRVIPGSGSIGRNITFMANEGASEVTSSCTVPATFPAGKTVHIDLGGTGRPVVGKLQPPAGFRGKVNWNFACVTATSQDADGQAVANGASMMATVDREGRFRMDDVPAGNYSLDVRFWKNEAGHLWNHRVHVPPTEGATLAQPVELGTLALQMPCALSVGSVVHIDLYAAADDRARSSRTLIDAAPSIRSAARHENRIRSDGLATAFPRPVFPGEV